MAVNALIAKQIFDRNPDRAFFIEESFPLDWMYPHLVPAGQIMELNRTPLTVLPDEAVRNDFAFWNERLQRFFGSGLQKELSMSDFLRSVETMFVDRKLPRGADPSFFSNDWAQRAFSKWRNSIAGLYVWRWRNAAADEDRNAMRSAAEYALRQAYQLCPWSTEVVDRYASFLKAQRRRADALALVELSTRIRQDESSFEDLLDSLQPDASAREPKQGGSKGGK
jgi:hypothetical protein